MMDKIVKRLHEQRQIEKAKAILESEGYEVKMDEGEGGSTEDKLSEMKDNPTYKKLESICQSHGYILQRAYIEVYGSEDELPFISIRQAQKGFNPDVYYNNDIWRTGESYFEIQTTSYGALRVQEYEEFLKGCQDAYAMVSELNSVDLSGLMKINRN